MAVSSSTSSFILAAAILIPYITDTRNMLASLNLGKTVPVGNADAGSFFNNEVLQAVDFGMSNVHPWFANQSIEAAAGWVYNFFEETNVQPASLLPNKPYMYIAETGWPTVCDPLGLLPYRAKIFTRLEHVDVQLQPD